MRKHVGQRHFAGLQVAEMIFSWMEIAFGWEAGLRDGSWCVGLPLPQVECAQVCLGGMLLLLEGGAVGQATLGQDRIGRGVG